MFITKDLKKVISKRIFFGISAAIVAFGTPAWSLWLCPIASIIGYGLFWYSICDVHANLKRFLVSSVWFFLVQLVQLSWFGTVDYQGYYILFVYVGLCFWLGIQFGFLNLFTGSKRLSTIKVLFVASLWTLLEISRLIVFCGFAFNPVGLTLCFNPVPSQMLSLVGIYGLSFYVFLTSGLFYLCLIHKKFKYFCLWVILGFVPYAFGLVHLKTHQFIRSQSHKSPLQVALIQTGLSPDEKLPLKGYDPPFVPLFNQWWRIFSYLKEHKKKSYDFIVLPEAAVPFGMKQALYPMKETLEILEKFFGERLPSLIPKKESPYAFFSNDNWYVSNAFWSQILSNAYGAEVVIGLDDTDYFDKKNYNAAFHFTPYGESVFRYEKRVLVPLAEYLPMGFLKPLVSKYGITDHATHGKESKVFGKTRKVAISICYEECFAHLMTKGRKNGANLFINITNDAWYMPSKLPLQHFVHGRLRSIENGVDVLRSCNTGVTGAVSSLGENISVFKNFSQKSQREKGALVFSFVPYSYKTLYTFWGNYFIIFISLSCIGFYAYKQKAFKRSGIELSC